MEQESSNEEKELISPEENQNDLDADDDSFDEKNKDLIDQEASEEEEDKIHAWGSQKEQFYQSEEQVKLKKKRFFFQSFEKIV